MLSPRDSTDRLSLTGVAQTCCPQVRVGDALSWSLGWGIEHTPRGDYLWHRGDNGGWRNLALPSLADGQGTVLMSNGATGLPVCQRVAAAALGGERASFAWLEKFYR